MKNKMKWIITPLVIICVTSLTYIITSNFLENNFNLLFRDWILALIVIICAFCVLIIEIVVVIKLNKIIEDKLTIPSIWKIIIQTISNVLISLVNLCAILICVLSIGFSYQEKGVEIYNGEKYVVRSPVSWLENPEYYYHLYKNLFVYDADIKYSGEIKWEDYSKIQIDDEKVSGPIPNIPKENTDDAIEDEEIEIIPNNIEYVQNIDDNLSYGFYLIDHAMHQYLYAFVQSKDKGLSWEIIYTFPSTSEIYYGHFLDKQIGFINFGSSEELSLFITNDGGLTWKDISINLPEENKNMLYVQDVKKSGEEIELILGAPLWSNSNKSIKYISVDKGLSWDLQGID